MKDMNFVFKGDSKAAVSALMNSGLCKSTQDDFIVLAFADTLCRILVAKEKSEDPLFTGYTSAAVLFSCSLQSEQLAQVKAQLAALGFQPSQSAREYDVVELNSGIVGTVVSVYSPCDYCIEYQDAGSWHLTDIRATDIKTVR